MSTSATAKISTEGYLPVSTQPTVVQTFSTNHPGNGPSQHSSNTTVVVQQPIAFTRPPQTQREWNTGLFDCFEDIGNSLCTILCPGYVASKIAKDLNENKCVPCCVVGGLLALRVKLRTQENIQGTICNDCCAINYCFYCAICQMARELDYVNNRN